MGVDTTATGSGKDRVMEGLKEYLELEAKTDQAWAEFIKKATDGRFPDGWVFECEASAGLTGHRFTLVLTCGDCRAMAHPELKQIVSPQGREAIFTAMIKGLEGLLAEGDG